MKVLSRVSRVLFVTVSMLCISASVHAQVNPELANCEELKDEATVLQADICAGHVGCKFVLGLQKGCAKAKKFLSNLGEIMARDRAEEKALAKETENPISSFFGGLKSALGIKPTINPNQIYEANMSDRAKAVEANDPNWKMRIASIRENVAKANNQTLRGKTSDSDEWVYVGDTKDGLATGWGVTFSSSGATRGYHVRGKPSGTAEEFLRFCGACWQLTNGIFSGIEEEHLVDDSWRRTGNYENGQLSGDGLFIGKSGWQYRGAFFRGDASGLGVAYRSDGSIAAKGEFRYNLLSVGERYDEKGNVIASVDKPREAREKAQHEAEEKRLADERRRAEERRIAEAKAEEERRVKREYEEKLAKMNAGELFAYADELKFRGDSDQAHSVLRQLINKHPNHAAANKAAQVLSNYIASERTAPLSSNEMPTLSQDLPCKAEYDAHIQAAIRAGNVLDIRYLPKFEDSWKSGCNSIKNGFTHEAMVRIRETARSTPTRADDLVEKTRAVWTLCGINNKVVCDNLEAQPRGAVISFTDTSAVPVTSSPKEALKRYDDALLVQERYRNQQRAAIQKGPGKHKRGMEANECLIKSPIGRRSVYNRCDFDVEVAHCMEKPDRKAFETNFFEMAWAFDCDKNQGGMWPVRAGQHLSGNYTGEKFHWFACKKPAIPISKWNSSARQIQGYCD